MNINTNINIHIYMNINNNICAMLIARTKSNKAFTDIRLRPGIAMPLVVVG